MNEKAFTHTHNHTHTHTHTHTQNGQLEDHEKQFVEFDKKCLCAIDVVLCHLSPSGGVVYHTHTHTHTHFTLPFDPQVVMYNTHTHTHTHTQTNKHTDIQQYHTHTL